MIRYYPGRKRACGLYTYDGKGKSKVVTLRQEGYKDDRVKAVLILNFGTRMTWVVIFTPRAPYSRRKSPGSYRIESWNFIYLVRNEPRIVQTLAWSLHQLCYPGCLGTYLIIDPPLIFNVVPSPPCNARIYCTLRTNFGKSLSRVLEDCEAQNLRSVVILITLARYPWFLPLGGQSTSPAFESHICWI